MATTKYSHAFLVGNLNIDTLSPECLDTNIWEKEIVSREGDRKRYKNDSGYNGLCTLYYKAHIDAMLEAEGVTRPAFLNSVHHFVHDLEKTKSEGDDGNSIKLLLQKGKYPNLITYEYIFKLCKLHLYFFPLKIILFSIEIDDSGTELDNLTAAHNSLMAYWDVDSFGNEKLSSLMEPLSDCLRKESARYTRDGNKFKIFQTIKVETSEICDELLYELATSSPIGCVKEGNRPDLKPSENYFNKIIGENSISTFDNWKGLALMDSFTMLGKVDSFSEEDCIFLYFPLIYLRCIFEKTFCFSRNNNYREDKVKGNLSKEVAQMEKYYFYDNISYNFQPRLLYEAMAKGLGIKEEREELSKQIKEKEEKNSNLLLGAVSVFAIFSVIYDFYSLIKAWCSTAVYDISESIIPIMNIKEQDSGELPIFAFALSALALITTITVLWYLKSQRRR